MPILTCSSAWAGGAMSARSTMTMWKQPRRKPSCPPRPQRARFSLSPAGSPQHMHAEEAVGEYFQRRPAIFARQSPEGLDRILVAVFRVDHFAFQEINRRAVDPHCLPLGADQMHLDATLLGIKERLVLERRQIKISAELTIHPRQEIEIEARRDAFGVIVGAIECLFVL